MALKCNVEAAIILSRIFGSMAFHMWANMVPYFYVPLSILVFFVLIALKILKCFKQKHLHPIENVLDANYLNASSNSLNAT